jgi:hypothetical protein
MPPVLRSASADERAWIAEQAARRLSPEEFESYVEAPVSEWERENAWALITWFTTRYKTPLERLAYARRAQARHSAPLRKQSPRRSEEE